MVKKPKVLQITKKCIFCGMPANSEEHIFSNWLRSILPNNADHYTYYKGGENLVELTGAALLSWLFSSPILSTKRQGPVRNRRERVVCVECNTGWMSRIVNAGRPTVEKLVKGEALTLGPAEQEHLANWLALCCTMDLQMTRLQRRSLTSSTTLKEFYDTKRVPKFWIRRIGRYSGKNENAITTWTQHIETSDPKGEELPAGIQTASTYNIGKLLAQVYTIQGIFREIAETGRPMRSSDFPQDGMIAIPSHDGQPIATSLNYASDTELELKRGDSSPA